MKDLILKMVPTATALLALLAGTGCSSGLKNGLIGLSGVYNYSPSVIESGNVTQFWWCSEARNPADQSQNSDTIQYESVNTITKATKGPETVLAETPGAWDSIYTCNPKVIEGTFVNPLDDGQTYTYALYYVALGDAPTNNIGVAFSNDGIHFNKYPKPVILAGSSVGYGVGQPVLFNVDHKSNLRLFYEDDHPSEHHVAATSTDGVHFTIQGTITTAGLDPNYPNPTWADMAYDPNSRYWYAIFNEPLRDPSTTAGITERGQFGVELYRIPDAALLTGSTPWQQLHTFDTNTTGFESNFIPGITHDPYGNLTVAEYPSILIYLSVSNPQPSWNASPMDAAKSAAPPNWALAPVKWTPNNALLPFYQYFNNKVHEVTTGWIDPSGNFQEQLPLLGHLYESPQQGASVAFYSCKRGSLDYFVSLDSQCEGARILGLDGYAFSHPTSGQDLVAVYRCSGADHFVSQDPKCGGQTTDELLGYIPK